jgi:hypothetical protein
MMNGKRAWTFYLFAVTIACCFFVAGCPKPEDVDCVSISEIVLDEPPIICPDGNEPQLCMAADSDNCGYVVNSQYLPCKSCLDCDATIDLVVMLCESSPLSVETSPNN